MKIEQAIGLVCAGAGAVLVTRGFAYAGLILVILGTVAYTASKGREDE